MKKAILIIVLAIFNTALHGYEFTGISRGFAMYGGFEIDPAPALSAGASVTMDVPFFFRQSTFFTELVMPVFLLDLSHYRLTLGNRFPLLAVAGIGLVNRFALHIQGTANWMHSVTALSFDESLLIGFFRPGWHAALGLGWNRTFTAYIAHTPAYRSLSYGGAVDGWYGGTGGSFSLSLEGGIILSENIPVGARIGYSISDSFTAHNGSGFFFNIGGGWFVK